MKKLEDIVLKRGDIVEFDDGDLLVSDVVDGDKASDFKQEIKSIKRPTQYETIYEAPHEILDKEEKEYLENVVRPFRDKVEYKEMKKKNAIIVYESRPDIFEWTNLDGDIVVVPSKINMVVVKYERKRQN